MPPLFDLPRPGKDASDVCIAGAEPTEHTDVVFLDQVGTAAFQLTHTVTQETVVIDGDGWSLEWDEGFAALVRAGRDDLADEPQVQLVEDVLSRRLLRSSSGEALVEQSGCAKLFSWDAMCTKFRECALDVKLPNRGGNAQLTSACFLVPRASGLRFWWDLHSLFVALDFEQYGGVPSHWCAATNKSWAKLSIFVFKCSHLVAGTQSKDSTLRWADRCLPHWSGSTALVILLAIVWSSTEKKHGGLAKDGHRAAAAALAEFFVSAGSSGQNGEDVCFELCLDDDWRCRWPRPPSYELQCVSLSVRDGAIDLSALQAASETGSAVAIRYWHRARSIAKSGPVAISHLLGHLMGAPRDKPVAAAFVAQICICLARIVETKVVSLNNKKAASSAPGQPKMGAKWTSWADLQTGYQLEHHLVRYVLASREVSMNFKTFVMACDAHDGCGKKLFNSVICCPDNVAILGPPQAQHVFCPAGGGADRPKARAGARTQTEFPVWVWSVRRFSFPWGRTFAYQSGLGGCFSLCTPLGLVRASCPQPPSIREAEDGFETEDIGGAKDTNIGQHKSEVNDGSASSRRHLAFLQRCAAGSHEPWRRRQLHRVAARRWLDNLDNVVRWSLAGDPAGLRRFLPPEEDVLVWLAATDSVALHRVPAPPPPRNATET